MGDIVTIRPDSLARHGGVGFLVGSLAGFALIDSVATLWLILGLGVVDVELGPVAIFSVAQSPHSAGISVGLALPMIAAIIGATVGALFTLQRRRRQGPSDPRPGPSGTPPRST